MTYSFTAIVKTYLYDHLSEVYLIWIKVVSLRQAAGDVCSRSVEGLPFIRFCTVTLSISENIKSILVTTCSYGLVPSCIGHRCIHFSLGVFLHLGFLFFTGLHSKACSSRFLACLTGGSYGNYGNCSSLWVHKRTCSTALRRWFLSVTSDPWGWELIKDSLFKPAFFFISGCHGSAGGKAGEECGPQTSWVEERHSQKETPDSRMTEW